MKALRLIPIVVLLGACQGSVPIHSGGPDAGMGAVLAAGRIFLPSGPIRSGKIAVNLESDSNPPQIYRLIISPERPTLYRIEPGVYRLRPTRNLFGAGLETLTVRLGGQTYLPRFPASLEHRRPFQIKTGEVLALGVMEARLSRSLEGGSPYVSLSLDDSLLSRRRITEQVIRDMMEPSAPAAVKNYIISWAGALQKSLVEMSAFSP